MAPAHARQTASRLEGRQPVAPGCVACSLPLGPRAPATWNQSAAGRGLAHGDQRPILHPTGHGLAHGLPLALTQGSLIPSIRVHSEVDSYVQQSPIYFEVRVTQADLARITWVLGKRDQCCSGASTCRPHPGGGRGPGPLRPPSPPRAALYSERRPSPGREIKSVKLELQTGQQLSAVL